MLSEKHFEALYQEHKDLVFNLSLNYVLNEEDAQDITQEVFVKVYQKFEQYNSQKASLKTWICQIAINQSLDFLKGRKRAKRFGFLTSLFHPQSNEPIAEVVNINHPGIALESKEELELLLKHIYALPDAQKTALILTKIEDRPQKEVAEIMNLSLKAVESLLQRAKQTIAKKLKETEGL